MLKRLFIIFSPVRFLIKVYCLRIQVREGDGMTVDVHRSLVFWFDFQVALRSLHYCPYCHPLFIVHSCQSCCCFFVIFSHLPESYLEVIIIIVTNHVIIERCCHSFHANSLLLLWFLHMAKSRPLDFPHAHQCLVVVTIRYYSVHLRISPRVLSYDVWCWLLLYRLHLLLFFLLSKALIIWIW